MVKFHSAAHMVNRFRRFAFRHLFLFFQKHKHALCRRHGGLQKVCHVGRLGDGLVEVSHILDKRLNIADFHQLSICQIAAQNAHAHIAQVADKIQNRHHQPGQKLGLTRVFVQFVVHLFKLTQRRFFAVKRLHHKVPAVHFLHMAVERTQRVLLVHKVFLRALYHAFYHQQRQRQHQQRHQRHRQGNADHHHQNAHQRCPGRDQLRNGLVQRLRNRVHIVGNSAQHIAMAGSVKIFERHTVDLLRNIPPQPVGHLLRDAGGDVSLNVLKQRA